MLQESLPPLNATTDVKTQEEALQKTYSKLSSALLDSFDSKRQNVEKELIQTNVALQRAVTEKTDMAVALYNTKTQVNHLNRSIEQKKNHLSKALADKRVLQHEWEMNEREIQQYTLKNDVQKKDLETTKKQYEDALLKIKQLQEINVNYTCEIKIQKKLQQKLKEELEASQNSITLLHKDLAAEKSKNEHIANQKKLIGDVLETQKSEMLVAQQAISKMHKEVANLENAKDIAERQWEESISAMSKRDKTFQAISDKKDEFKSKTKVLEKELSVLKKERDDLAKALSSKEQDYDLLNRKLMSMDQNYETNISKLEEARNALMNANNAEKLYKQEIDDLKKINQSTSDQLGRKTYDINELKAKLESLKCDFDEKVKLSIPRETVLRREEALREQARLDILERENNGDVKHLSLRRENALLKSQIDQNNQKLLALTLEHKNLKSQHTELTGHYSKLYDEAKHMIYAIERKEHDLSILRGKVSENETVHSGSHNLVMSKMKKELLEAKSEADRLQQMWLETQKDALKKKDAIQKLQEQNALLLTKLGTAEGVKSKIDKGLSQVKNESFEQKMELAKLYNELKRIQPVMDDLKRKNINLEEQLEEARLKLEEAHTNNVTSTHMLRSEIRRLMDDRSELKHQKAEKEKVGMNLERKSQLYQEMVDKLKGERYELQRENYTLKRRAEEAERKLFDAKLKARKQAERQQRIETKVKTRNETVPEPRSFQSEEPQTIENQNQEPIKQVPDFESWRLRLDSLESEKEFLINENNLLKVKLKEYTQTSNALEVKFKNSEKENTETKNLHQEYQNIIKDLEAKVNRGRKVAAFMEKQIKDAKPNFKIDYQILGDVEPSIQLLATLMARDVGKPVQ